MKVYGIIAIVLAIIFGYFTFKDPIPIAKIWFFSAVALDIIGIISAIMPEKLVVDGQNMEELIIKMAKF
jgi:hypothetical protein